MHIYPCSSDLPPCICIAFSHCISHSRGALGLHTSGKGSCCPSPRGFLPPPITCHGLAATICHVHPREQEGQGQGPLSLPAQPSINLGEQPPSNLQLGSPLATLAVALSTRCSCQTGCQRGKALERKRKKEGTEPERPLQVFSILRKHPDEPTLERPPPCSMVAVLPAETTLNAEEHFKTQS